MHPPAVRFGAIYSLYIAHPKPGETVQTLAWLKAEAQKQGLALAAYDRQGSCIDVFTGEHAPIGRPMETFEADRKRYRDTRKAFLDKLPARRAELGKEKRGAVAVKYQEAFQDALARNDADKLLATSREATLAYRQEMRAVEAALQQELVQLDREHNPDGAFQDAMRALTGEMGRAGGVPFVAVHLARKWHARGRFDLATGQPLPAPWKRKLSQAVSNLLSRIRQAVRGAQ